MKKILIFLSVFITINCTAQISVKFLQIRPVGNLGAIMKKTFTGEIMYLSDFDDDFWRARGGISFANFKPRLDTFPVYIYQNGITVIPGYEVIHKYNLSFLFIGSDFRLINPEPFSFYLGFDMFGGNYKISYDLHYKTVSDESFSLRTTFGGFRLRAGAEYKIDDHSRVYLEVTRGIYDTKGSQRILNNSYNDIGLGFHYIF